MSVLRQGVSWESLLTAGRSAGRIAWLSVSPCGRKPRAWIVTLGNEAEILWRLRFAVTIEGQAVRTWVGVGLVIVCLGLAGCSLFGKKQTAHNTNPKPFTGAETPAQRDTVAVPAARSGPLPGANGMLAGQIVSEATGRPVKAYIRVKNLDEDDVKLATIDVETNDSGYFTIPRLKVGGHYQLIPRAEDGGKLASQKAFAIPPNPAMLIQIDKRYTTPSTPPLPDAPKIPDKKGTPGTESSQDRTPAASLERPIRIAPERDAQPSRVGESVPGANGVGANPGNGNPPNLSNVAEGFRRVPRDPDVNIHYQNTAPWPTPPPTPPWEKVQDERPPPQSNLPPATSSPSVPLPNRPPRVPSCVLLGNKLDNFALNDLNGQTWEYRRNHTGRLVLLDFWHSKCTWCLYGIGHLNELQGNYGPYGLEVIGIACETGTVETQVHNAATVSERYKMRYRTLLCGGGPDNCPVINQFRVHSYPTLFLLDETGTIIWTVASEGWTIMPGIRWKRDQETPHPAALKHRHKQQPRIPQQPGAVGGADLAMLEDGRQSIGDALHHLAFLLRQRIEILSF